MQKALSKRGKEKCINLADIQFYDLLSVCVCVERIDRSAESMESQIGFFFFRLELLFIQKSLFLSQLMQFLLMLVNYS